VKIGWRTITRIKRFLCERQNALVKKKIKLKDMPFEIKIQRFDDLLKEINENICRNNPISPDLLGDIFEIFLKDGVITPCKADKNKYLVSEVGYQAMGIEMERLGGEKLQPIKKDTTQGRPVEQKFVEETPKPSATKEKKRRKRVITPIPRYGNVKCRVCLNVTGYTEQEKNCKFCGAKLFKEGI